MLHAIDQALSVCERFAGAVDDPAHQKIWEGLRHTRVKLLELIEANANRASRLVR